MPRQRMKAADRKHQILRVAQRLFAGRGYSMTTTAAIAAGAGVTEPILYRHFASKKVLFLELLDAISDQMIAQLKALAGQKADPVEQIKLIITSYPQVSEKFNEPFAMIDRALAAMGGPRSKANRQLPDVRPLLAHHYQAYETLMADIVHRGQKQGQLRMDIDARVAAWFLIHAALGWRLSHNLAPEVFARRYFVPQSAQLLLDGLMKR
ncbi:MAG: TetR family transcriptional regulator [Phycisphaerae bacterium]|nr:TetR family transcriptional regulator [Phycisphaerae bacterium]